MEKTFHFHTDVARVAGPIRRLGFLFHLLENIYVPQNTLNIKIY
jgi:hypothetical protein